MSIFNGEATQRDPIGTTESEDKDGSANVRNVGGASSCDYAQCGGAIVANIPPSGDFLRCTEAGVLRVTVNNIFRRVA